jgi:hypothetical protein
MSASTFVIELLFDTVLHILPDRTLHIVGTSGAGEWRQLHNEELSDR